jgi:hypothetical protein
MAGAAQYSPGAGTAVSIVSAPASVVPGAVGWWSVNNGGTVTCYLGGSGVSTTNGYPVIVNATTSGYVFSGDNLFAVSASGTGQLNVLQMGA